MCVQRRVRLPVDSCVPALDCHLAWCWTGMPFLCNQTPTMNGSQPRLAGSSRVSSRRRHLWVRSTATLTAQEKQQPASNPSSVEPRHCPDSCNSKVPAWQNQAAPCCLIGSPKQPYTGLSAATRFAAEGVPAADQITILSHHRTTAVNRTPFPTYTFTGTSQRCQAGSRHSSRTEPALHKHHKTAAWRPWRT